MREEGVGEMRRAKVKRNEQRGFREIRGRKNREIGGSEEKWWKK